MEEALFADEGRPPMTNLLLEEKTLLSNIRPISLLATRMDKPNLMLAHAAALEAGEISVSDTSPLILEDGLVRVRKTNAIYILPSLEGIALSYAHLLCGHVGWVRLYHFLLGRYHMPDMKNKAQMKLMYVFFSRSTLAIPFICLS